MVAVLQRPWLASLQGCDVSVYVARLLSKSTAKVRKYLRICFSWKSNYATVKFTRSLGVVVVTPNINFSEGRGMVENEKKYWFPAKCCGWGWGIPCSWQGWVVLIAFFIFIGLGAFIFSPINSPLSYVFYVFTACLVLIGICWIKGEPPRWRWGK